MRQSLIQTLAVILILQIGGFSAFAANEVKKEISLQIANSSAEELRQQSPAKIRQILLDGMASAKKAGAGLASEGAKIGEATRAGVVHSTVRLLPESGAFFIALGTVVARQVMTDYAQNPVGLSQFLAHQISPVGAFSFWTFMATQGVTSNLLMMYLQNPKFHSMIPYMGMTVGFAAQSFVSEIISDPDIWTCASSLMGTKKVDQATGDTACAAAHEHFILTKKLAQYSPGFVSMMLSVIGADKAQKLLIKGSIKVTGVDIGVWFIPGALEVRGVKLLLVNGLRLAIFTNIQAMIEHTVTLSWKNMVDSRLLIDSSVDLRREINQMKKNQWQGSDANLKAAMKDITEKMSAWRMANLSEVYEAHANWAESLGQLQSMYGSTYSYYSNFIGEVRNSRFNLTPLKLLERPAPFAGVLGFSVSGELANSYFTSPQMIEPLQLKTIDSLVAQTEKDLQSVASKGLTEVDKAEVRQVLRWLKQESLSDISQGFEALRKARYAAYANWPNDRGYMDFLNKMLKTLGDPQPASLPGMAFNKTFLQAPSLFQTVKDTSYYRHVGTYSTPQITDYLMMQMICGPDLEKAGTSSIKAWKGLPVAFQPPQIKNSEDDFWFCKSPVEVLSDSTIYNADVKSGNKAYHGFPEYLIHEARASIVGDEKGSNFTQWWEHKVEPQMIKAFAAYQEDYQEIVAKLIEGAFTKKRHPLNLSPLANGTVDAAFQEEKMNLAILQDLLNPAEKFKLELENYADAKVTDAHLIQIDQQLKALAEMIQNNIKIVILKEKRKVQSRFSGTSVVERKVVQSTLVTKDLQAQLKVLQDQLVELQKIIDGKKLSAAQNDLAKLCSQNLQNIALEFSNYATIAHAVSWNRLNEVSQGQQAFDNKVSEKAMNSKNHSGGIRY